MPTQTASEQTWLAEVETLIAHAQAGDLSVLPQLQTLLDRRPEIWQHCGDLAAHAVQALLTAVAGNDHFVAESVRRKLAAIQEELAGPASSPLEKLLVERVAVSWLAAYAADIDLLRAREPDQGQTALSDQARQRLDSAHRRYLFALKQLALVRKLLTPAVSPLQLAAGPVDEIFPGHRGGRNARRCAAVG